MVNAGTGSSKRKYIIKAKSLKPTVIRLYLSEDKTIPEIAEELKISEEVVEKLLGALKKPKRSKGEITLLDILKTLYPNQTIQEQTPIEEYQIDIYIPHLRLGFEFDGQFHFGQNKWIHGDGAAGQYRFEHAENNDHTKDRLAKEQHIYIIRIPYTTKLTVENVRSIINEHISKIITNLNRYSAATGTIS